MSRTNKSGIAKVKAQQQKNAKLKKGAKKFEYPKRNLSLQEAKELGVVGVQANPAGREYHWFLRGRKICRETKLRVDGDGYRMVRLPSGSTDFVTVMQSGWTRRKLVKQLRSGSVK